MNIEYRMGTTLLHYCPHLRRNIVLEQSVNESGDRVNTCLNKGQCGCMGDECKNALINGLDYKTPFSNEKN